MEKVDECVVEYGLKVNANKSKVVCINGDIGRRRWMMLKNMVKYAAERSGSKYVIGRE